MNLKTSKTLQVKKCPEILSPTVGLIHIIDINATEVTRISDLIIYKNTGLQKKKKVTNMIMVYIYYGLIWLVDI